MAHGVLVRPLSVLACSGVVSGSHLCKAAFKPTSACLGEDLFEA